MKDYISRSHPALDQQSNTLRRLSDRGEGNAIKGGRALEQNLNTKIDPH